MAYLWTTEVSAADWRLLVDFALSKAERIVAVFPIDPGYHAGRSEFLSQPGVMVHPWSRALDPGGWGAAWEAATLPVSEANARFLRQWMQFPEREQTSTPWHYEIMAGGVELFEVDEWHVVYLVDRTTIQFLVDVGLDPNRWDSPPAT